MSKPKRKSGEESRSRIRSRKHAGYGPFRPAPANPEADKADPAHNKAGQQQEAAPAMDHSNMQMQGGSAPADARDPHAYSGGYGLASASMRWANTTAAHGGRT
jgi:copper resistance protein B